MRKSPIIVGIIVAIATALSFKSNLAYAADGIPAITAGTSGLPRMDVVDVSSNNGNISVASFKKMHQYGVNAVIVKLTEATSYRNPYAATQIANAKAAGLRIGAYHYSWYTSQSSAQSEAKYFTNYAKSLKLSSDTLMVDDLEDTYTMTNNVTSNAKAFNTQLKAAGFSNTSLYTGLYYKNTTGLNFSYIGNGRAWIAQYPFTPSSNSLWNTTYGMWQWNSNTSFPGVSGTFDVSIDYTNLIKQSAKYKVGDVVRIASNAWSETNGYTLVNRQNWIGTVVSAKPNIYGNSAWEYDIQYPNGAHSVHVAEQDVTTIPAAKYTVGQTVRIASNAWSETNGYTLVNRRNWVGTVISAKPKAHANSAWEYDIQYPNGVHSVHVAEQDVTTIPAARYTVGQTVRIASNAWSETNGYTLVNRRNWVGTVISAKPKAHGNSAWEYDIRYSNGVHSVHVAEQDLIKK